MMKYKPINSLESPRFAEVKTFMRLPYVKTTEGIDYAIVGVPFDTGVTYRTGQTFWSECNQRYLIFNQAV